jgi:hypothetical protein
MNPSMKFGKYELRRLEDGTEIGIYRDIELIKTVTDWGAALAWVDEMRDRQRRRETSSSDPSSASKNRS